MKKNGTKKKGMKKIHKHTIIASGFVLGAALVFGGAAIVDALRHATVVIPDQQITLDGDFKDWPAAAKVVDESTDMDVAAQEWCWNGTGWDTIVSEDECKTFVYNDEGQVDIQQAYFGVNSKNMYFGIQNAFPWMAVKNMSDGSFESISNFKDSHRNMVLPQDYVHQVVFSFGPKNEEVYNNYMVVSFNVDKEMSKQVFDQQSDDGDQYSPTISVYKESGVNAGFNNGEDVLLGSIDTTGANDSDTSTSNGKAPITNSIEVRVPVKDLFNFTGMDYLSYGFRMETHGKYSGADTTKRIIVNLGADAKPSLLRPFLLKRTDIKFSNLRKTSALIQWKATASATSYNVRLDKYADGKWSEVKVYTGVKTVKKQINAGTLKKDTQYRFQVSSCNAAGCSAYSPYKVFKTPKK